MTNFEPDIIDTIESLAIDYVIKNNKLASSINLSKDEFRSYEDERRAGRLPKISYRGKTVILPVRRIS